MARRKTPEVKFSNLQKVFFPKTGFTKGEMIQYYIDVAPFILPHLRNRPITLIRLPDGVEGEKFYEKNAPSFAPDWLETFAVNRRHEAGKVNYILINSAAALAWCANIAAVELHPFLHRTNQPAQPTHVVFDLDPGEGADIRTCAKVAFLVKAITDRLGLEVFPKVSGSKGLQLYVPLNTATTYAATSAFAKSVAELLEQQHPELVVSSMEKARRRQRVLIDWSQNNVSKTTVAVYSMRAKRDEPFISMPVTWAELKKTDARKLSFTPAAALKRLKKLGDLFAPVLKLKQRLPKAFAGQKAPEPPAEPLKRYAAKRDFTITAEPGPALGRKGPATSKGRFVIQKHAASHLHYDFRLEMDGTLKSWAVPKGLSTDPGIKRAAFEVEDHPVNYLKFEGTIPQGQYGGGTVMVWDLGTYELLGGNHGKGDLKLMLRGEKLKGEWHLFRIRSDESKPMWLIAKSGPAARAVSAKRDDQSVLSGRTMAQIAAGKGGARVWRSSSH
jgi:bifunctional non-homologous end joining protein LigD